MALPTILNRICRNRTSSKAIASGTDSSTVASSLIPFSAAFTENIC
jgi:hypothetical protein